jgi:hypothetical protein
VQDPYAGVLRRAGGGLPLSAQAGEEAVATGCGLVDDAVAGVAVVVDAVDREERARPVGCGQLGHRAGEGPGGLDPAVQQHPLVPLGPSPIGHPRSGEVDHGLGAGQRGGVDAPGGRIPRDLVGPAGFPPHKPHHLVPAAPQPGLQPRAEKT